MILPEITASPAEKRTRLRLPKRAAAVAAEEDISVSVTSAKAASPAKKMRAAAAPGFSPEAPLSIDEAVGTEAEEVVAGERQGPSPESKKSKVSKVEEADLDGDLGMEAEPDEAVEVAALDEESSSPQQRKATPTKKSTKNADDEASTWCFVGDPVPEAESKQRWPARYQKKNGGGRGSISGTSKNANNEEDMRARWHYLKAKVDGCVYNLYDDAYVKAGEGEDDYIGRIVEFFEGTDRQLYFTAQWFFRAKDTVIKDHADSHDCRRVFLSEEKNDNVLDCLVSKIEIVRVAPNMDLEAKEETIPPCDLYYDMSYSLAYSAFANLPPANARAGSETSSTVSSEDTHNVSKGKPDPNFEASSGQKAELSLLDLYSGCGAMSTGLCLGANMSGVDLETRWAVDINRHACESLKLNHPRTEVRNEKAEDFLSLLKEWEKLCNEFSLIGTENSFCQGIESNSSDDDEKPEDLSASSRGEFEVGNLVGICFGDPHNIGKIGLKFKVRWKGYGPSEDTWEPMDGLSKCQERIENFVRNGFKRKILPLPGDVDVICGGPPCQGISGFNRFRNKNAPLEDPKNHQMVIFMDIVEYLKPKYVLMENVVDILKFAHGFLGRYALSQLVSLNYQSRLGIMAAGCYGLPQFRMRCFLWGAQPSEKLPQFPLPTHDVVVRGCTPNEFEQNIVAYDENQHRQLEKALLLGDAISDLPPVTNAENRDEMEYGQPPKTEFQRFIRLTQHELIHSSSAGEKSLPKGKLLDHMPLQLNDDDYQRVCRVPKKKGANFRDLPGVMVGLENVVEWDPTIDRVLLPSGKPLVPDYAMSFLNGKSSKPFARLWWDETVPTVVTRAEPHNQAIMHPEQDRVLTIRENARLQGFPDYYKLCGPVKERYIQVGNAVAVPVSRALGYALGLAFRGDGGDHPLFALPPKFPCHHVELVPGVASEADETLE